MAITNGYCTLAELKAELDIPDSGKDSRLERVVEAVSRLIDGYANRHFYQTADGVQRFFTARDPRELALDDAVSISAVAVDRDDDGTFEEAWVVTTDYVLGPKSAAGLSRPYSFIRVPRTGSYRFPVGYEDAIRVTGKWGWPAEPKVVKEACLIQSNRIFNRHKAAFGLAPVPALEGSIRLLSRLDADVELLLKEGGVRKTLVAISRG